MDLTGLGSVFDFAKGIMDKIWPPAADPNKKLEAQILLQTMLETRENNLIEASKSVIVSEMQQGDTFTKRARPCVVYAGLGFIFLNHVFIPVFAFFTNKPTPTVTLPAEFWWAWTGVVSVWMIGRSYEKAGVVNTIVSTITGNKPVVNSVLSTQTDTNR